MYSQGLGRLGRCYFFFFFFLPINSIEFMEKKGKENIFENCTCQQVNKNKERQRTLQTHNNHLDRSWPLLTAFARSDKGVS